MNINQIWQAIDKGKKVYWSHKGYEIIPVKSELNEYSKLSYRNGYALRCICVENYFGSLVIKYDLKYCYIE